MKEQGQYLVIMLSLKDLKFLTWEDMLDSFAGFMSRLYESFSEELAVLRGRSNCVKSGNMYWNEKTVTASSLRQFLLDKKALRPSTGEQRFSFISLYFLKYRWGRW